MKIKLTRYPKKVYRLAIVFVVLSILLTGGFFLARASALFVTETYDNPEKIASKSNMTICGGQVKLSEATWSTLSECNCNSLAGWYWYTTNGRSACWSKTLADSVSWNKGVGNNVDNPGAYTCATSITSLKDRMLAVTSGEWYKIVSDVNSVSITSSHNGSAGYSLISAVAITDCIDGTRDLCTGNGCLGANVTAVNTSLRSWASATNSKSALPYCADSSCGTSVNSDFRNACEQNSTRDYPLACYSEALFYSNRKTCGDGDTNYSWAAAASFSANTQVLGYSSCAIVNNSSTSITNNFIGFRAVVRP